MSEWVLSGNGLCLEGVMSEGFLSKGVLSEGVLSAHPKTHDQIRYNNNISNPGGSYLIEYPIQLYSI